MRDGSVDVAVHSLKDLPTQGPAELVLAAVPPREDVADALIAPGHRTIDALPPGARVGTGSPRRRAQLLFRRPDLEVVTIRGNVETRLNQALQGRLDAVVLAWAGLKRLGLESHVTQRMAPPDFLPAVGQGALGIECRRDDAVRPERCWHHSTTRPPIAPCGPSAPRWPSSKAVASSRWPPGPGTLRAMRTSRIAQAHGDRCRRVRSRRPRPCDRRDPGPRYPERPGGDDSRRPRSKDASGPGIVRAIAGCRVGRPEAGAGPKVSSSEWLVAPTLWKSGPTRTRETFGGLRRDRNTNRRVMALKKCVCEEAREEPFLLGRGPPNPQGARAMPKVLQTSAMRQIQRVFIQGTATGLSDAQLLERFAADRDEAVVRDAGGAARPDGAGRLPGRAPRPARRRGCLPGHLPGAGSQGGLALGQRVAGELAVPDRAADRRPVQGRRRPSSPARAASGR